MSDEAKIIGASIKAAGRMLEVHEGDSLELAVQLIRSKLACSMIKSELGEDGKPLADAAAGPCIATVAVSKLEYTQESIKREFKDGRQFHDLVDDLHSGNVNLETHPRMMDQSSPP